MENILVIQDDKMSCDRITSVVSQMGHSPASASTLKEGLQKAQREPYAVIFLESQLPDGSGLDNIARVKSSGYFPEIIIITGFGNPDEAEHAITNGAWDYLEKPVSLELIKMHISQIIAYQAEKKLKKPSIDLVKKEIIGSAKRLEASFDLLSQAAQSDVNVLITGESGTGKSFLPRRSMATASGPRAIS